MGWDPWITNSAVAFSDSFWAARDQNQVFPFPRRPRDRARDRTAPAVLGLELWAVDPPCDRHRRVWTAGCFHSLAIRTLIVRGDSSAARTSESGGRSMSPAASRVLDGAAFHCRLRSRLGVSARILYQRTDHRLKIEPICGLKARRCEERLKFVSSRYMLIPITHATPSGRQKLGPTNLRGLFSSLSRDF